MNTVKGWTTGLLLLGAAAASQAAITSTTFSGTSGARSASAVFFYDDVKTELKVVLTNTATTDAMMPVDILTSLFFSQSGSATLSPLSAKLTSGSTVIYDSQPSGGVVGGEWAYGKVSGPGGRNSGISSVGLGLFGNPNFPGDNLHEPQALNGLEYGITTAGDNSATGNGGVTGSGGLIKNSVTFMLDVTGSFSLANLSNIFFQYGTSLSEPGFPCSGTGCGGGGGGNGGSAPEPGSIALAGLALLGLAATRRRA